MYYPSVQDIQDVIEEINGRYDVDATIINEGQLKSALAKPQMQIYGHELYPELHQKAAALMEEMTKVHTLSDGNKRCAMAAAEFMIKRNGAKLVLPLKTIRLSVDTAMDENGEMTEEIQQWFKVHIARNTDRLTALVMENAEEERIILSLLKQGKSREADDLLSKWMAFDSYPEHKATWYQLVKKWESRDPTIRMGDQTNEPTIWKILERAIEYDLEHPAHSDSEIHRQISDLNIMGHTLKELVQFERKINLYEKRLADTNVVKFLFGNAHRIERFGWVEEALEFYKRILKIDQTQDHAYYHIGLIYGYHLKNHQKAIEKFRKCLELNPTDPYTHHGMAIGFKNMNRNEDALKEINRAIQMKPEKPEFYYTRSMIQTELEDFDGAKESIEYALKKRPAYFEYLIILGHTLEKIGRYDEAIKAYQKAASADPESLLPVFYIASVYFILQNYNEAIKYYSTILQKEPNNLQTLISIGGACFQHRGV